MRTAYHILNGFAPKVRTEDCPGTLLNIIELYYFTL
jgi:hypothetical protein